MTFEIFRSVEKISVQLYLVQHTFLIGMDDGILYVL